MARLYYPTANTVALWHLEDVSDSTVNATDTDQSQLTDNDGGVIGDAGGNEYDGAQRFTPTKPNISGITVSKKANTGNPGGNLVFQIVTDSSGPTTTVLASTQYTAAQWNALADGEQLITLSCTLTPGTNYWLKFTDSSAESTNNYYSLGRKGSGGGGLYYQSENGGAYASLSGIDLYYKTHYETRTDQVQTVQTNNLEISSVSVYKKAAQSFVPTEAQLSAISFIKVVTVGSPTSDMIISIEADSTDTPSGTPLVSHTYTAAEWNALTNSVDTQLSLSVTLTPGTKYWIVFSPSAEDPAGTYRNTRINAAGGYGSGTLKKWTGAAWVDEGYDLYFKTHYTYTLTNNNSVTFVPGKFNNCADLGNPNTSKYLSILSTLGLVGSNSQTHIFWVKLQAEIGSGNYRLYLKEDATEDVGYTVHYEYNSGTRRLNFNRWKINTSNNNIFHDVTLGTTWHMIAYTFDGADFTAYLDGALVESALTTSGNGASGGTDQLSVGSQMGTEPTPGYFDEVIVEDYCWTEAQILNYYNATTAGLIAFM